MKHSANLEGLYKAATILDPQLEAARIIAARSNNPLLAAQLGVLDIANNSNAVDTATLEHMLPYMSPQVDNQFRLNLNTGRQKEIASGKVGKHKDSLYMKDPNNSNMFKENPEALAKLLNTTLNNTDSENKRAEEENGSGYYLAHNLAGIRPVSGAIGNIPFVDKLSVTKGIPLVPGAIGSVAAGALTGLATDSAAAGLSTGFGGAAGTLAGAYLADKLGFNLAGDMLLGGKLGALLGSGLGYAGYSMLSGKSDKKKKKDNKDKKEE